MLLVGPSNVFLRYIEQVLPSLGESDAILWYIGERHPAAPLVIHRRPGGAPWTDGDLEAFFDFELAGELGEQGGAQRHLQRGIGLRQHL